jgi:hypothetical protein
MGAGTMSDMTRIQIADPYLRHLRPPHVRSAQPLHATLSYSVWSHLYPFPFPFPFPCPRPPPLHANTHPRYQRRRDVAPAGQL